jgi:hypothetical protein
MNRLGYPRNAVRLDEAGARHGDGRFGQTPVEERLAVTK